MENNMKKVIQILGWLGVLLILSAYFLTTFGYLDSQNKIYLLLNIFGSIFIILETYQKKDYQPFILNIFWLTIAIVAIIKVI
jgi:hypothetical protein